MPELHRLVRGLEEFFRDLPEPESQTHHGK